MATPGKTRRAGTTSAIPPFCAAATSALALVAGVAHAQSDPSAPTQVVIDQVQLGPVSSTYTLNVTAAPSGATTSSTSVANSGLGSSDVTPVNYQATQEQAGTNIATTSLSFANTAGPQLTVQTSATGNTGTGGTAAGSALTGSATQTVDGFQTVTANANLYIGGPAPTGAISMDTSAIANTQGWQTGGGSVFAASTQTQYGETLSTMSANVAGVSGPASYTSTAVGNNVTSDASDAPATLAVNQTADGFRTRAEMNVIQASGADVTAASTATSNNINVTSDSFTASLTSTQFNTNPTQAEIDLNVGAWSGSVTATSYGVANSAIVSNAGPTTTANGVQTSTGDVSAATNFTGGQASGDATVLSTAVGNAYSAYACADCNGGVGAAIRQTSSGGVSATTSVTTAGSGVISGASAAIGNTATVQVKR